MKPQFDPVDAGLRVVSVHDVTFPGFGGDPIKGWLVQPAGDPPRGLRRVAVSSEVGIGSRVLMTC